MARTDRSNSKDATDAAAGKDRRRARTRCIIKGCLVSVVVLIAGLLLFSWWLASRSGDTYAGNPEFILPPDTIAMGSYRGLAQTLDGLEKLPAVEAMTGGRRLGGWLLTEPVLNDRDETGGKTSTLKVAGDRFLRRYFGEELTLALVPPLNSGQHSALLLVVKAKLGFEENLSELALLYNPKFKFESEEYKGVQLRRYVDGKLERSFSYCRFGDTVVLCLRSQDWAFLKAAVDRSQNLKSASLGNDIVFVESMRDVPNTGLRFFARPEKLPDGLRAFPSDIASSDSWGFWFDYFEEKMDGVAWLTGSSELDDGISAHFLMPAVTKANNDEAGHVAREHSDISTGTLAFFGMQHSALAGGLSDLFRRMGASSAYEGRWDTFSGQWIDTTGSDLLADWAGGGITGATMSVDQLYSGILGPVPEVTFMFDFDNQATTKMLARKAGEIRASMLGMSHFRASGSTLAVRLNGELPEGLEETAVMSAVTVDDMPEEGILIALGLLQIDAIREALMITGPPGGAWNLRTKEKMQEWRTLLDTLSGLKRLDFKLYENGENWEADARLLLR